MSEERDRALEAAIAQIKKEYGDGSRQEEGELHSRRIEANKSEDFIMVTAHIHMRRAMAVMREQGLDPVPSPSSKHSEGHIVEQGNLLPHPAALQASRAAVREGLAQLFYWFNGWTGPPWVP